MLFEQDVERRLSGLSLEQPQDVERAYRFTVKFTALLVPSAVVTVTFTLPYLADFGTLHLIWLPLQDT